MHVIRKSQGFVAIIVASLWICPAAWGQSRDVTEVITPLIAEPQQSVSGANTPTLNGGQIRLIPQTPQQPKQDPCQIARQRFVQSAMFYDANQDESLAYHEARNLLMAIGQAQFAPQGQTPPANSDNTDNTSAFNAQNPEVAARQLRAFVGVFMRLSKQFDANRDAQLSSTELLGFAEMLMQFDPSLAGEACLRSRAIRNAVPQNVAHQQPTRQQIQQLPATQIQSNGTTAYNICVPGGTPAATGGNGAPVNLQTIPIDSGGTSNPPSGSSTTPAIPGLQQGFSGETSTTPTTP